MDKERNTPGCVCLLYGYVVWQMTQESQTWLDDWMCVRVCVNGEFDVSAAGDIMQTILLSASQRFHLENEMQHHR